MDYHTDEWLQVLFCKNNIALQDWHLLEVSGLIMTEVRCYSQMSLVFASLDQMDDDECEKDLGLGERYAAVCIHKRLPCRGESVMVWKEITAQTATELVFIENSFLPFQTYVTDILEDHATPFVESMRERGHNVNMTGTRLYEYRKYASAPTTTQELKEFCYCMNGITSIKMWLTTYSQYATQYIDFK